MTLTPIERFAKEYQDYNRISGKRAREQRRLLASFELTLDGRSLVDATADDLQAFAGALLAEGLHVNTVRKKLNMVRPFYSWAYAVGLVTVEQYMRMKLVKNPRGSHGRAIPRPYTRKELAQFWGEIDATYPRLPKSGTGSRAIDRWVRGKGPWARVWRHAMRLQIEAMVRLALDCGLRRGEIYGLKVDDLHSDNEYLVVWGKADPSTGEKKVRQVPMTTACRAAVEEWLAFRALMHPGHDAAWLSCYADSATQPMWLTRFDDLLGEGWTWHRFRHTAGTEWLRAGAPLEVVSKLLGHGSLMQTLGYAQIVKGDIAVKLGKVEGAFAEAVSNRAA